MRRLLALAAATLVVAAAGPVVLAPPASAAACTDAGTGVTVVVDFNDLGGGEQVGCVPDGGGDQASTLFPDAGFVLTYAQQQPGFVCRVKAVPKSDPCVRTSPASAYWGLWWSTGNGSWTYSSEGVGSLNVPDGGYVAFAWDDQQGQVRPALSPSHTAASPTPTPTTKPSSKPSSKPGPSTKPGPSSAPEPQQGSTSSSQPGSPAASTGAPSSGTPSSAAAGRRAATRQAEARRAGRQQDGAATKSRRGERSQASESATPSAGAPTSDSSSDPLAGSTAADPPPETQETDGLPVWLPPLLGLGLLGAVGAVLVARRRGPG